MERGEIDFDGAMNCSGWGNESKDIVAEQCFGVAVGVLMMAAEKSGF